jgi:Rieske Fe-S protein
MSENEPSPQAPIEPEAPRRGFLKAVTNTLLLAPLVLPAALALEVMRKETPRQRPGRLPALPLAQIPEDAPIAWRLAWTEQIGAFRERVERLVFLRRSGDEVIALSSECTHLGCPVSFEASEGDEPGRFFCPCHKGWFGIDGEVLEGPPPTPLPRYKVLVPSDRSAPVEIELL